MNNLEKWLEATIANDGLGEEELIARVKESYKRSLVANIEYHALIAKKLQENGEPQSAKTHNLLANIYISLAE